MKTPKWHVLVYSSPLIATAFVVLLGLNAPANATVNCWYTNNVGSTLPAANPPTYYATFTYYPGINQLYSDLNTVTPTGYAMAVGYNDGTFHYSLIGAGGHGPEFSGSNANVYSEYENIQTFSVSFTGTDHYSMTEPGPGCPQVPGR